MRKYEEISKIFKHFNYTFFALKTEINGTGEIVHKLRALTVLQKDLGLSSRTHMAPHKHLSLQFHRISHPL